MKIAPVARVREAKLEPLAGPRHERGLKELVAPRRDVAKQSAKRLLVLVEHLRDAELGQPAVGVLAIEVDEVSAKGPAPVLVNGREAAPLRIPDGATVIDTDDSTLEQSVERVVEAVARSADE